MGLTLAVACVGLSFAAARLMPVLSPLVASLLIGLALANARMVPRAAQSGLDVAAGSGLRLGVVLLGLQLALGDVARVGVPGLAVVLCTVTVTFIGTQVLGRRLGVSPPLALLVATGSSICGASAVAAMQGVAEADEEEVAFAVATVTLCGTAAMLALPLVASIAGLDGESYGLWVGASVHDVAQVVAASAPAGTAALRAAIVVKLTRVLFLAPLVAAVALTRRRRAAPGSGPGNSRAPVPLFVIGFAGMMAVRSLGIVPMPVLEAAAHVEKAVLAGALVGLGSRVDVRRLRRIGGRPLLLGVLAWALAASVALAGVLGT